MGSIKKLGPEHSCAECHISVHKDYKAIKVEESDYRKILCNSCWLKLDKPKILPLIEILPRRILKINSNLQRSNIDKISEREEHIKEHCLDCDYAPGEYGAACKDGAKCGWRTGSKRLPTCCYGCRVRLNSCFDRCKRFDEDFEKMGLELEYESFTATKG